MRTAHPSRSEKETGNRLWADITGALGGQKGAVGLIALES